MYLMPAISGDVVFIHLLLAATLFFAANWLGRHSILSGYHLISLLENVDEAPAFNFVFRVATPLTYLAITAAFLYGMGLDRYVKDFYLVVVYYFAIRWLYNIVIGRVLLLNWPLQIATAAFTVACAYFLYHKVLAIRGTLLPDARSLNSNLWVLIVIYVYTVLNGVPFGHPGAAKRRDGYILRRYRTLHEDFAPEVSAVAQSPVEEALVYAVLIYETFNRPYAYRLIERWILFPLGRSRTLGPMQVETQAVKSDPVSVREGATKLLEAFRRGLQVAEGSAPKWLANDEAGRRRYVRAQAAHEYNIRSDYAGEIQSVYEVLVRQVFQSALPT
jgi:hypothetical protein